MTNDWRVKVTHYPVSMESLVAAARMKLAAQAALREAEEAIERAAIEAHKAGVPKTRLGHVLYLELVERGFTQEEISAVALSPSTCRQILDRPRYVRA